MKPFLKYPGGKTWLVPLLEPIWRHHLGEHGDSALLFEPFCGSAAVSFGLEPSKAVLNDFCWPIRNVMVGAQVGHFDETWPVEFKTPVPYPNADDYLIVRADFNRTLLEHLQGTCPGYSQELALLFFWLNRTCFNGLVRFNAKGEFNVPPGKYTKMSFPDMSGYPAVMKNWRISHGDFAALDIDGPPVFTYIDPPYDGGFVGFTGSGFDWSEQVRLAAWSAQRKGPVVVSNAATARVIQLYRSLGFRVQRVNVKRSIAAKGASRKAAPEILATKNL